MYTIVQESVVEEKDQDHYVFQWSNQLSNPTSKAWETSSNYTLSDPVYNTESTSQPEGFSEVNLIDPSEELALFQNVRTRK